MKIEDVVDVRRFPWIWNVHQGFVRTRYGRVSLPYGYLSDGDSWVLDEWPEAWFAHDRLYHLPVVTRALNGRLVTRRLNRFQVDLAYGHLLLRAGRPLRAVLRPLGLMIFNTPQWGAWKTYRRKEKLMGAEGWARHIAQTFVLPHATAWRLPTMRTADAIWMGDEEEAG